MKGLLPRWLQSRRTTEPARVREGANVGGDAEILYRLDDRDEIIFVNDAWSVFANANDGEHLIPSQVLRAFRCGI